MADPVISSAAQTVEAKIIATEPKVLTFIKANYVKIAFAVIAIVGVIVWKLV